LEPHLGKQAFSANMGVLAKMKIVLKQSAGFLRAETVAKALTEVNRKIAFTLDAFMVGLKTESPRR
jgi:hypothetical protein